MFEDITTWSAAFAAMKTAATDMRGSVETTATDDSIEQWPRTTGHDVIAIASLIDPLMRMPARGFGGHALARRWQALAHDLETFALRAPDHEFAQNRTFWPVLASICVHLDAEGAPTPPTDVWDGIVLLFEAGELRNIGPTGDGPFKHFDNVRTFDDLFNEQLKYLRELRGFDELAPEPGMTGGKRKTPRATNADVVALADYWSTQFADVKEVMGHQGALARWKSALVDVDNLARRGDPNAAFPKNNAFWRDLQATAIHIAAADEAPTKWDLAKDAIKDSVKNLPENIKGGVVAVGDAVGDLAHGAGTVVSEVGRGLFSGVGTPVLVGAGLVGLYLLSRNRSESAS